MHSRRCEERGGFPSTLHVQRVFLKRSQVFFWFEQLMHFFHYFMIFHFSCINSRSFAFIFLFRAFTSATSVKLFRHKLERKTSQTDGTFYDEVSLVLFMHAGICCTEGKNSRIINSNPIYLLVQTFFTSPVIFITFALRSSAAL